MSSAETHDAAPAIIARWASPPEGGRVIAMECEVRRPHAVRIVIVLSPALSCAAAAARVDDTIRVLLDRGVNDESSLGLFRLGDREALLPWMPLRDWRTADSLQAAIETRNDDWPAASVVGMLAPIACAVREVGDGHLPTLWVMTSECEPADPAPIDVDTSEWWRWAGSGKSLRDRLMRVVPFILRIDQSWESGAQFECPFFGECELRLESNTAQLLRTQADLELGRSGQVMIVHNFRTGPVRLLASGDGITPAPIRIARRREHCSVMVSFTGQAPSEELGQFASSALKINSGGDLGSAIIIEVSGDRANELGDTLSKAKAVRSSSAEPVRALLETKDLAGCFTQASTQAVLAAVADGVVVLVIIPAGASRWKLRAGCRFGVGSCRADAEIYKAVSGWHLKAAEKDDQDLDYYPVTGIRTPLFELNGRAMDVYFVKRPGIRSV